MASEVEAGREQVGVFVQRLDRHRQTAILCKDFTNLSLPGGHAVSFLDRAPNAVLLLGGAEHSKRRAKGGNGSGDHRSASDAAARRRCYVHRLLSRNVKGGNELRDQATMPPDE